MEVSLVLADPTSGRTVSAYLVVALDGRIVSAPFRRARDDHGVEVSYEATLDRSGLAWRFYYDGGAAHRAWRDAVGAFRLGNGRWPEID